MNTPVFTTPSQRNLDTSLQQTSPQPDYVPTGNARKRRADGSSSASSRGVANLTPEQLAKKRANDREAQRAIRERTRNQIETLEKRIQELESQQPFQELQNVIRSRDAVMAENEELKRRMQSVLALAQPMASPQSLSDLAAATAQQSPLPMPMAAPGPQTYAPPQQQQQQQHVAYEQHLHPDLRSMQSPQPTSASQSLLNGSPAASGGDRHYAVRRWSPSLGNASDSLVSAGQSDVNRNGVNFLLANDQRNDAAPATASAPNHVAQMVPQYSRLPVTLSSTCPLDSIFLEFLEERRSVAAQGANTSTLVGPAYPSISSMLNPAKAAHLHPLSKVFSDILAKFPNIQTLPEQVAVLYIMFLIMRWHVAPTEENYNRLPEWIRPVRAQLESPHPAWLDHLPWPAMRQRMTLSPDNYPFDAFFAPYCATLSLNWPYEPRQCLLESNHRADSLPGTNGKTADGSFESAIALSVEEDEEFSINPVFESHLRNLDNWSLGKDFGAAFPDLMEGVRIRDPL